jgi:DNA repair protein RadC
MVKFTKKVSEPSRYHSKISSWPGQERPREKLMSLGASVLSEAELLAILIHSGTGAITALDIAKTLMKEFGALEHLATRSFQELKRYKGIGEAKSSLLVAAFELGRRTASAPRATRVQIGSPSDVAGLYLPLLRDLKHEVFKVLLLDSANHLLREVTISAGILNSSLVHPREVFQAAILEPAASIILLHNHPSGNPEPSSEDIAITRQIVEAGKILGIPVHDHVILAVDRFSSFAERGLI